MQGFDKSFLEILKTKGKQAIGKGLRDIDGIQEVHEVRRSEDKNGGSEDVQNVTSIKFI
ncbi:hypothetical protein LguiA_033336 [Lonicera macranthoides]